MAKPKLQLESNSILSEFVNNVFENVLLILMALFFSFGGSLLSSGKTTGSGEPNVQLILVANQPKHLYEVLKKATGKDMSLNIEEGQRCRTSARGHKRHQTRCHSTPTY
ncbi:13682_t:CDS:2 [Acaulospora morrowiae]|uniref:13682_t:CDS:1 n=1 Tax=Acaulospora morrowiae TaxID=94023 RepID=A0A9N9G1M2_9GLOM|nr:13682_t:CDS:2 [Acaulospora morrowiae]